MCKFQIFWICCCQYRAPLAWLGNFLLIKKVIRSLILIFGQLVVLLTREGSLNSPPLLVFEGLPQATRTHTHTCIVPTSGPIYMSHWAGSHSGAGLYTQGACTHHQYPIAAVLKSLFLQKQVFHFLIFNNFYAWKQTFYALGNRLINNISKSINLKPPVQSKHLLCNLWSQCKL